MKRFARAVHTQTTSLQRAMTMNYQAKMWIYHAILLLVILGQIPMIRQRKRQHRDIIEIVNEN